MNEEEKIKGELEEKFTYLKDAVVIKRKGRLFVELDQHKFKEIFDYAVKHLHFDALSGITGLDMIEHFAVIYHLNRQGSVLLNIKLSLNKDSKLKTVTSYFPGADIYEREMEDLLGISVEGLKPGHSYPLPDKWPKGQHPLLKSWPEGGKNA